MKKKPKLLILIALVIAVSTLSIPLQIALIYEHSVREVMQVLNKITLLNWFVIFTGLACSISIFQVSSRARVLTPIALAIVGLNNWIVAAYGIDFAPSQAHVATAGFALLCAPLFAFPKFRWILAHPKQRWWLTPPRKQMSLPLTIGGLRLPSVRATTFDLSETGAFVPLPEFPAGSRQLNPGDGVTITLHLGSYRQLRCEGRVVRLSKESTTHPEGLGITFLGLRKGDRHALKRVVDQGVGL